MIVNDRVPVSTKGRRPSLPRELSRTMPLAIVILTFGSPSWAQDVVPVETEPGSQVSPNSEATRTELPERAADSGSSAEALRPMSDETTTLLPLDAGMKESTVTSEMAPTGEMTPRPGIRPLSPQERAQLKEQSLVVLAFGVAIKYAADSYNPDSHTLDFMKAELMTYSEGHVAYLQRSDPTAKDAREKELLGLWKRARSKTEDKYPSERPESERERLAVITVLRREKSQSKECRAQPVLDSYCQLSVQEQGLVAQQQAMVTQIAPARKSGRSSGAIDLARRRQLAVLKLTVEKRIKVARNGIESAKKSLLRLGMKEPKGPLDIECLNRNYDRPKACNVNTAQETTFDMLLRAEQDAGRKVSSSSVAEDMRIHRETNGEWRARLFSVSLPLGWRLHSQKDSGDPADENGATFVDKSGNYFDVDFNFASEACTDASWTGALTKDGRLTNIIESPMEKCRKAGTNDEHGPCDCTVGDGRLELHLSLTLPGDHNVSFFFGNEKSESAPTSVFHSILASVHIN